MNNLEAATKYAEKGWMVFPCNTDKSPKTKNGKDNATTDMEQIKEWWSKWPDASIGMATGPGSGVWVLDIDMPNGNKNLQAIEQEYGRIPDTLIQRTGGGGLQYFFRWNGREIRNSSSKIAKNIDVRGDGGYVILPPSSHPSNNVYRWITKNPIIEAPEWLADKALNANSKTSTDRQSSVDLYNQKALAGEISKLAMVSEGERNETLNRAAYSLGQLISGNGMDRLAVESALLGVAISKGLTTKEAQATIQSGIEAGLKSPRTVQCDRGDRGDNGDTRRQNATKCDNGDTENGDNESYNLVALIQEWVENSTGSFTNADVDREFNLVTREQKKHRSKCLNIYKEKKLVRADKRVKGKWHVIDNKVEWVDLTNVEDVTFPINLPFDLHQKISIPTKSIIVLAGTTNAGKTAFILNTLLLNLKQKYEKVYLMSEMGGAEYKHRVLGTGCSMMEWNKNIKAAEKSNNFDGMVQNFNPDGLTCIDYLEEIEGEYFKIASSIRDIYDALGDGVALIAIQKRGIAEFGRGGEGTAEKARLYMTIDFLCSLEHCIVCALKIVKAKHSLQENMIGKELHFKIEKGSCLTALTDWTPSHKVNRGQCIMEYEMAETGQGPTEFKFMTKGGEVTLRHKDYMTWLDKFTKIDLGAELRRVSEMSYAAPWMEKKSWFFQLGGYLDKQNKGNLF